MKIRELVGKQIGQPIPRGGWDAVFKSLDMQGKFDAKTHLKIIVALCKYLEGKEEA